MDSEEQHLIDWNKTKDKCEEVLMNIEDAVMKGYMEERVESCKRLLPKDK